MISSTELSRSLGDSLAEFQAQRTSQGLYGLSFEELRNAAIGVLTPDSSLGARGEPVDGIQETLRSRLTRLERVEQLEREVNDTVAYILDHAEDLG